MACATGPLIVDHGSRNNIRYNAAAADWTARRDSLTSEGIAFMDTARHWLNSALRTKLGPHAGNASITYARLDFLFFEGLSQSFDDALMDGTMHFSMKFCFLSLVGRRIGEANKYPDKEMTDQDFARWLAKTITELAAAGGPRGCCQALWGDCEPARGPSHRDPPIPPLVSSSRPL